MTGGGREGVAARVLRIEGRVQRVGYRAWFAARAEDLGMVGYVRNLTDGSVEALIVGSAEAVERLTALAADGPLDAVVARVATRAPDPGQRLDLQAFRQAPTGDPGSAA